MDSTPKFTPTTVASTCMPVGCICVSSTSSGAALLLLRGGMIPVAYVYPPPDALHPRPAATSYLSDAQTGRATGSCPTHPQSIQPARDRQKDRLQSRPYQRGRALL